MSNLESRNKLTLLASMEGVSLKELLEAATFDSVASGICMNPGCDYASVVEPDATEAYCPECDENTVKSCLIIARLI